MGFFSLTSGTLHGMTVRPVQIEVDISFGLPRFLLVGLPDLAVQESKERIRSALQNSGFSFPKTAITVNLAPAHERKQGSHHDVAIALAILAAEQEIKSRHFENIFIAGELGLAGELRSVRGILPLALFAKKQGKTHILTAPKDAELLKNLPGITSHGCKNLQEIVQLLNTQKLPTAPNVPTVPPPASQDKKIHPFNAIRGNHLAKRALAIAVAGKHPLLFIGPPGSGKTLIAKTAQHLLPELSFEEALEVACVASLYQPSHDENIFSRTRPFRSPHHHTSSAALIGGGSTIVPGEISLAHHGILFLDELPEFPPKTLEALRQPLEDGEVHIARASGHITFPAQIQLLCAMNPCPCGFFGDAHKTCVCDQKKIQRYQERISEPLLERIDIFVDVPRISSEELLKEKSSNEEYLDIPSTEELLRVRTLQEHRLKISEGNLNTYEGLALPTQEAKNILGKAIDRFQLSGRGYTRLLRVSRTIADLAHAEHVEPEHVSEALGYRSRLLTK